MNASDFNEIRKIIREEIKEEISKLATKEELEELRKDVKQTVLTLISRINELDEKFTTQLEITDQRIERLNFSLDRMKDLVIDNQAELRENARRFRLLESKV